MATLAEQFGDTSAREPTLAEQFGAEQATQTLAQQFADQPEPAQGQTLADQFSEPAPAPTPAPEPDKPSGIISFLSGLGGLESKEVEADAALGRGAAKLLTPTGQAELLANPETAGVAGAILGPVGIVAGGDSPIAETEKENRHKAALGGFEYTPQGPMDPLAAEKLIGSGARIVATGPLGAAATGLTEAGARAADIAQSEPGRLSTLGGAARVSVAGLTAGFPMKAGAAIERAIAAKGLSGASSFIANALADAGVGTAAGTVQKATEMLAGGVSPTSAEFWEGLKPTTADIAMAGPSVIAAGVGGAQASGARRVLMGEPGPVVSPERAVELQGYLEDEVQGLRDIGQQRAADRAMREQNAQARSEIEQTQNNAARMRDEVAAEQRAVQEVQARQVATEAQREAYSAVLQENAGLDDQVIPATPTERVGLGLSPLRNNRDMRRFDLEASQSGMTPQEYAALKGIPYAKTDIDRQAQALLSAGVTSINQAKKVLRGIPNDQVRAAFDRMNSGGGEGLAQRVGFDSRQIDAPVGVMQPDPRAAARAHAQRVYDQTLQAERQRRGLIDEQPQQEPLLLPAPEGRTAGVDGGKMLPEESVGISPLRKGGGQSGLREREIQGQTSSRAGLRPLSNMQSQEIAATPTTAGNEVINQRGEQVQMPDEAVQRSGIGISALSRDPDVKAIKDSITTSRDARHLNLPKFTDRLRTELFDKFRPIQRLSQASEKLSGEKLKATEDPYKIFRGLNRKIISTVNRAITQGFPKFDNSGPASPPLREVLAPVSGHIDDFDALLAARRTPEMAGRQDALPFGEDQAAGATERLMAEPGMVEAADNYDKYMDAGLQYALDSGLKTQEEINQIRAQNQLYAPWERVDEDGNIRLGTSPSPGRRPDQPGDPLKRVTKEGSTKNIVSPLETSIKNSVQLVAAAQKNAAKRQMVDVASRSPELAAFAQPIDKESIGRISPSKVITVKREGQTEYYQVDPEIKKTLEGMTPEDASMFDKLMTGMANAFRGSVTLDPPFAVNNLFRDGFQQSIISRSAKLPLPLQNQARGLRLLTTGKGRDTWKEWYNSAANQAIEYGAIMDRRGLLEDMDRQARRTPNVIFNKDNINPKNWPHLLKRSAGIGIHGLNKTMQKAEAVGRVGEYDRKKQQSLKKGMTEEEARAEAEFESADLGDFSMGGRNRVVQGMRRWVPFFGSGMSFAYREAGALKDPKTWINGIVALGGMEALNFYMNEDNPDYWNLPDDQRRRYWHIPTGNGKFFALPKPIGAVGYLFTEPFRNLFDKYMAGASDPDAVKFVTNLFGSALPPVVSSPIKTTAELMAGPGGYSYFYDRPIVDRGLQHLPPEMQYTDRTSLAARYAGKGLNALGMPVSPQKIDYLIGSGAGSGIRRGVETVVDPAISKLTGERAPGQPIGESLAKRNYFSPEDKGSEAIDEFYEKLDRIEKASAADKAGGEHADYSKGELKRMRKKADKLSKKRKMLQNYVGDEEMQRKIKRSMVYEIKKNVKEEMPETFSGYKSGR